MLLPVGLVVCAVLCATVVAYGVHPDLAQFSRGLGIIMFSRRLMWPLVAVSLLACLAIIGLVISGRNRAWWLLGLAPVLALFFHRFHPGAPGPSAVLDRPVFVAADSPLAPADNAFVVGVIFESQAWAFPFRALFATPVVEVVDYDQRMLLMWSALANRATAVRIRRELRARDLEAVSTPANSLLIYDRRLGQFICAVTALRPGGQSVLGFGATIPTQRMTWAEWRAAHRSTKVMTTPVGDAPDRPIRPLYALPRAGSTDPLTSIAMIMTSPPLAVRSQSVQRDTINLTIGSLPVVIVRDPKSGRIRAFDRRLRGDLIPQFTLKPASRRNEPALVDSDSSSTWTFDGAAVAGSLRGEKMRELDVEDELYLGVMQYWFPQMQLLETASAR
ncbi:MAG: DUF3179 domain-containing (seleno)protein [Tepidisphaeraceae bacterium]